MIREKQYQISACDATKLLRSDDSWMKWVSQRLEGKRLLMSKTLEGPAQARDLRVRAFEIGQGGPEVIVEYLGAFGFIEAVNIERHGVPALDFFGAIQRLKISNSRALEIFDIPKSTAAHKIKTGGRFEGTDALASLRLNKLLTLAESIASNSLHPDAKDFDSGKWLGEWIETPQPGLGGLKPSELLDTEAGGQRVFQLLAALESGSYQ